MKEEVSRLAGDLVTATGALAASEGRLAAEVQRAAASKQEFETQRRGDARDAAAREKELSAEVESLQTSLQEFEAKRRSDARDAAAREKELSAEVESLQASLEATRAAVEAERKLGGDREQAQKAKIEAMMSTLGATEAVRDTLQARASEQGQELVQLTKLYVDGMRTEVRLQASVKDAESAAANANARVAEIRAETSTFRRDQFALLERHLRENSVLSDRLAKLENELNAREDQAGLLRDVNALYTSELAYMDQRLAEIQAGATRTLAAPVRHLRAWFAGRREGMDVGSSLGQLRRSRWFDADWYVSQYHDVAASGLAPEAHYLARGAAEARNPSPGFDTRHYLASNPDVEDSGQNPLLHFIRHGEAEGRSPLPERDA